MICHERGMFSFDFGGNSEASARSALSAELDKWMARQKHEAEHYELLMAVLLDYQIQSLARLPASYLATVRVNVESQAGNALPRVILYRLTRDPKAHQWRIRSTFNGN